MQRFKSYYPKQIVPAHRKIRLIIAGLLLSTALQACDATRIDRHGHVFTDIDLQQIHPGVSKDQVRQTLGTPDTTGTLDGDVFYYISSMQRTRPMGRPKVIERKILAIYFDQNQTVRQVANYGLKDGKVIDFIKGGTPASGKQLTALQQLLGNIANRRSLLKQGEGNQPGGLPR